MSYLWNAPFHYYSLPPMKLELVDWLKEAKFPEWIIQYTRSTKVIFGNDCRFDFESDKNRSSEAVDAFIIPVKLSSGFVIDTLAWSPNKNLFGTWEGECFLGDPLAPRLNENAALAVYTNPKDWLSGGMKGVLIVNFGRLKYTDLGDFGPFEVQTQSDFYKFQKAVKRDPVIFVTPPTYGGQS